MGPDCPFCIDPSPIVENSLAFARFDRYPVSEGHLLVIPRRHVADFFELTEAERSAVFSLVQEAHGLVMSKFQPTGFNIGINVGAAAGQTVWHVHVHLIPRYLGDVEDPRGGVRGVIPGKQRY